MTTCEKCGKELPVGNKRFCSAACANNIHMGMSELVCAYCGKTFSRKKSMVRERAAFCCLEHGQLYRRKTRAKATHCERCKADLSPKDLVRIGQYRAHWRKAGKGEPPHLCLACRPEVRKEKPRKEKPRKEKPLIMTPHWFNCYECGVLFWRTWKKTICSAKCKNKRSHRECMADPKKHVSMVMRISIGQALRGEKNRVAWSKLVGYGPDELIAHIERTMTAGMTWDNYGSEWHIDHIIPVSRFNYEKPTDPDFIRCWSLKNLQAMWATDNIRKSDKIEKPFQPCLAIGCEA